MAVPLDPLVPLAVHGHSAQVAARQQILKRWGKRQATGIVSSWHCVIMPRRVSVPTNDAQTTTVNITPLNV